MQIKDIEINKQYQINCLISESNLKTASNGSNYIHAVARDKTGSANIIIWDPSDELIDVFTTYHIVSISGIAKDYKGNIQLTPDIYMKINDDIDNYITREKIDVEDEFNFIVNKIDEIENYKLGLIVDRIFENHQDLFKYKPAAKKMHHAFEHGLLHHTYLMLKSALYLQKYCYNDLNKDLIIAGIILHDIGKVIELSDMPYNTTKEGSLLGHISIMDGFIIQAAIEENIDLNSDEIVFLRHIILSHHGQLEWGSPIYPQIKEAIFIHHIDNLDAKMQMSRTAFNNIGESINITENIYPLNNVKLYRTDYI